MYKSKTNVDVQLFQKRKISFFILTSIYDLWNNIELFIQIKDSYKRTI